jgi:hypothetical protein
VLLALTPVVEALELLGVRYHIGGSVASSAYGLPRSTADIDLVADLRSEHVPRLLARLEGDYYIAAEAVRDAVQRRGSFNLIHLGTMIKLDLFVPGMSPFDEQELSRAQQLPLQVDPDGRTFPVKSPEDLVLRKLLWYRAGGEVSEQQWRDVVGVLEVQGEHLDADYMAAWAAQLGVADLLERAMADAKNTG